MILGCHRKVAPEIFQIVNEQRGFFVQCHIEWGGIFRFLGTFFFPLRSAGGIRVSTVETGASLVLLSAAYPRRLAPLAWPRFARLFGLEVNFGMTPPSDSLLRA